jgi:hypothetical protein
MVPISDEEYRFLEEHGAERLEQLFQEKQIDVFDLSRASVASNAPGRRSENRSCSVPLKSRHFSARELGLSGRRRIAGVSNWKAGRGGAMVAGGVEGGVGSGSPERREVGPG